MSDTPIKFTEDFTGGSYDDWRALVETAIGKKSFEKAMQKHTLNGVSIDALNTQETALVASQPVREDGVWAIVSPHWGSDPQAVNADMLEDLGRGASAVAVTVDEAGSHGLKPSGLAQALENIYLNMAPITFIHQGPEFSSCINAFEAMLSKQPYSSDDVSGLLGVDPIGSLARFGYLNTSAEQAISDGVKHAVHFAHKWPNVATFVADGTVYSNAGAGEIEELAACLSTAVTYLRQMEQAGMDLDTATQQIQFTLSAGSNLWQTIAKFRTLRRLWQEVLIGCGIQDKPIKINAVSAVYQISMKDPWVNILRGTASCFGAAIGGADTVTVLPHDLMLGTTNKFTRKIARNVQIILQEESNLSKVIDPSAGSYSLETLTQNMTLSAWKLFQEYETAGGILSELRSGALAGRIKLANEKRASIIRTRKMPITGISEFPDINEKSITGVLNQQPSDDRAKTAVECIEPLVLQRTAWHFERLRFLSDEIAIASGKRPSVFLANLGSPADFTARATFAKNFFEAGGIEAISGAGITTAEQLTTECSAANADFAILCGTDEQYGQDGAGMIRALKQCGMKRIYLAGKLIDDQPFLDEGLSETIYMGCDVVAVLERAYDTLSINSIGQE